MDGARLSEGDVGTCAPAWRVRQGAGKTTEAWVVRSHAVPGMRRACKHGRRYKGGGSRARACSRAHARGACLAGRGPGELPAHAVLQVPAKGEVLVALRIAEEPFGGRLRHLLVAVGGRLVEHHGGSALGVEVGHGRYLWEEHCHLCVSGHQTVVHCIMRPGRGVERSGRHARGSKHMTRPCRSGRRCRRATSASVSTTRRRR